MSRPRFVLIVAALALFAISSGAGASPSDPTVTAIGLAHIPHGHTCGIASLGTPASNNLEVFTSMQGTSSSVITGSHFVPSSDPTHATNVKVCLSAPASHNALHGVFVNVMVIGD